jgi:uncharacterized damage-inducible protein DinB
MTRISRKGAIGALLDIYEDAISGLKNTIEDIPDHALTVIVDPVTTDENCRSFQTILSHVVHAAYGYATSIHNLKTHDLVRKDKIFHQRVKDYMQDLDQAFEFTLNVFKDIKDNEIERSQKILANWGQDYDIEQMMEHAIIHIFRHKRQIKKFKGSGLTKT